jgi:hypothetical protein
MRNIHIVPIIKELRKIKPKGADIEEALIFFSRDANLLKNHILNPSAPETLPDTKTTHDKTDGSLFKILGVSDDGYAYFIDRSGRMQHFKLRSLSKTELLLLADMSHWEFYYGSEGRVKWDYAINDIISIANDKDFSAANNLGRGAWKTSAGFCYHDGRETFGNYTDDKIFLRKEKRDIGINDIPVPVEICQSIGRIALQMTFETKLDAVRCLAWSCLAPFAGALPWRPSCLLTGGSGTGKTTIINGLIKKIGVPEVFNGAETTPAYLRAKLCNDSCGVVFDETEGGEKAQRNRQELFLVMRQSTSDDAPKVGKSNKDQGVIEYDMRNMFLFSSIHAGIDSEADEKRILRINLQKNAEAESKWKDLRSELNNLVTEKNCRGIRAFTWQKLPDIVKLSDRLDTVISKVTGMDLRSSFAEALILACYFIIWRGMNPDEITDDIAAFYIADIYASHEKEERNESEETLNKLLDNIVFLAESHKNKTLREMLIAVKKSDTDGAEREYIETLERYGLKLLADGVAIQKDNGNIKKILESGNGYNKILWRHKDCINKYRRVRMAGAPRTCVVIARVLDDQTAEYEDIPM